MRQLFGFAEAMRVRKITSDYYNMAFHAQLHRAEIKSLEEILGVSLDENTNAVLDARAQAILNEKKAKNNV